MSGGQDDNEKSHEPTEQKLLKAREKGEVARSTDLSVAAAYAGILVAAVAVGNESRCAEFQLLPEYTDILPGFAACIPFLTRRQSPQRRLRRTA